MSHRDASSVFICHSSVILFGFTIFTMVLVRNRPNFIDFIGNSTLIRVRLFRWFIFVSMGRNDWLIYELSWIFVRPFTLCWILNGRPWRTHLIIFKLRFCFSWATRAQYLVIFISITISMFPAKLYRRTQTIWDIPNSIDHLPVISTTSSFLSSTLIICLEPTTFWHFSRRFCLLWFTWIWL